MSNVLITGGAGFIGSNLAERLSTEGYEVTVVDDLSMGLKENLPISSNIAFYEHSITDHNFMKQLLVENQFDYIFLLAAVASVADSIARPYATHIVNQEADIFILETLREEHLYPKKILFSSSAAIYGNNPELPKREVSAVQPLTPYAIDKFATENFVLTYARLYKMNAVAVRFFNVYGPRQNPRSPYSGVLSILTEAFQQQKPFTVFGDGTQSRDFVYIDDVLNALELLTINSAITGDVFNVATGSAVTLNQVIDSYQNVTNKKIKVKNAPDRVGDIKHSAADISKLKAVGFAPRVDVESGLRKYWEYVNASEKLEG